MPSEHKLLVCDSNKSYKTLQSFGLLFDVTASKPTMRLVTICWRLPNLLVSTSTASLQFASLSMRPATTAAAVPSSKEFNLCEFTVVLNG